MEVYGQPLDRSGLLAHVGQLSQVAGIRLVTLADGAGRGTRLLEFRSGAGLDHAMSPQTADATDPRFPAKLTNDYPLHGRLSGEPATLVGYGEIWSGDECTLWAEGVVRQVSAFGEVLQLRRRIDCRVLATVVNALENLAVYEHYRSDTLPYLVLWRMLGQGTYVVGLEPSTNGTAGRHDVRAKGELVVLEPGESREYDLVIGAHSGAGAVAEHLRRH